ncbi:MAG: UvrB/UvrC motif-containing protein [Planctomycetes bacterium]|nr:UvrB/UvrC motif-containing protein [Planctomycetota bacterium]
MQDKCTHCGKSQCKNGPPTVLVLDVSGGKVVGQHYVCRAAAEALGFVQPKPTAMTLTAEMIEQLTSGLQAKSRRGPRTDTACPGCGMTLAAFRERGRLGCPRCYEVFKPHLLRVLERVHDAVAHRGRFPGRADRRLPDPVRVADLHEAMRSAIREERYEEAAKLRDEIRQLEERHAADPGGRSQAASGSGGPAAT